jgi:hypothetical protein
MIDRKYIELINYEIDGIITPEQRSQLQEYLLKNPKAKKLYQELTATNSMVNSMPEIEPTENLKKRVLNSINFNKYQKGSEKSRVHVTNRKWLFDALHKPAYAFVFGIIFTAIVIIPFILSDLDNGSDTHQEYWGTTGIEKLNQLHTIEQIPVGLDQISGSVYIKTNGDLFIFEPDLRFDQQTELKIIYDPAQLQLADIKPTITVQKMILEDSSIRISGSKKIQTLLIFSTRTQSSSKIQFETYQNGRLRFQRTILLNPDSDIK